MKTKARCTCLIILFGITVAGLRAQSDGTRTEVIRQLDHQDPQWQLIRSHLPDPMTASAKDLETAGDVLRARRFPVDALEYYGYAIQHGGNQTQLMNKMGVTELELRHPLQARAYFQRVVKIEKKNPEGWNNLGAVEYMDGRFGNAISNYKRAIKLDKTSATFHSNLGTAYFEKKDFESARQEYDIALKLDPDMLNRHGTFGVTTRMLSPEDHARFCFELARLYAQRGDEEGMLHYLTVASEAGFDILSQMSSDAVLGRYRKDPRIVLIVRNAKAMRNRDAIAEGPGALPPLPPPVHDNH